MKTPLIALISLAIGLLIGWQASKKGKGNEPSKEVQEMFEAVIDVVGPMGKEEFEETLTLVQNFNESALQELDLMTLWRANTANQILLVEKEKGTEAAQEHARYLIGYFRESYEEGMSLGNWKELADKLYANTEVSEPGEIVNASAAVGKAKNHLHD